MLAYQSVPLLFTAVDLLLMSTTKAYCHGRGGGELGKEWYEKGKMYNKGRAIEDFLACGVHDFFSYFVCTYYKHRDDHCRKQTYLLLLI